MTRCLDWRWNVLRRALCDRWRIFWHMTFCCWIVPLTYHYFRCPVVCPPQDLSREGPFDPYCTVADTGDVPLVPAGLPWYRYQMTSYDSAEVADVDPAYGLQLHHPRFLEYVGAPETAGLLTRTPEHWVNTMDRDVAAAAALQLHVPTSCPPIFRFWDNL